MVNRDYVLSGGELPAMTLIDSVSRLFREYWDMKLRQRKIPLLKIAGLPALYAA